MEITAAVFSGFVLAAAAPWVHRLIGRHSGWVFAILPAAIAIVLYGYLEPLAVGQTIRYELAWVPALGATLSFHIDGLSILFGFLIAITGVLVLVYSAGYLGDHPQAGRFYAFLLMFMASMFGLVFADNLIVLFVFWELTSISSYLLIGFNHEKAEARSAAWQALLITAGGGLALLAGFLLLAMAGGSYELTTLLSRGDAIRGHDFYLPLFLLVLLGAATKSAQFPFHSWLPGAMAAPTPVSAYLHSATMVKAGIYLLARMTPALGGTEEWHTSVATVGAVTMLVGGILAVAATDLKQILAYSTVSALGTLTMLLGLGTNGAVVAAVVFLLSHALYKGALFMFAGSIDYETGTREIYELGGLWRKMPVTAGAGVLAGLALVGLGPFLSFIGKEAVFETAWEDADLWFLLVPVTVFTSALSVVIAGMVVWQTCFGPRRDSLADVREVPLSLWLGPVVLAISGLAAGVWAGDLANVLIAPAVHAITATPVAVKLKLWHGLNPALIMSAASVLIGAMIFVFRRSLAGLLQGRSNILNLGPDALYHCAIRGLDGLARVCTQVVQSGYLRYYLFTIVLATVVLVGYSLAARAGLSPPGDWTDVRFYEVGLLLMTVVGTIMTILARSYLTAIVALGVVGYTVALIFVLFGAPDLAMTQFLIETLTVILFLLVFARRRQAADLSHRSARLRDALLAASVGVLITSLVLVASAEQFAPSISRYFVEHSVKEAHGRNVVNVILVDFRGVDTLGEITVLAAAGVGVYGLLRLRYRAASKAGSHESEGKV